MFRSRVWGRVGNPPGAFPATVVGELAADGVRAPGVEHVLAHHLNPLPWRGLRHPSS